MRILRNFALTMNSPPHYLYTFRESTEQHNSCTVSNDILEQRLWLINGRVFYCGGAEYSQTCRHSSSRDV